MTEQIYYLILAMIMLLLLPIVPQMLGLRIAVLKKLHWSSLAGFHERHRGILIKAVRAILLAMATLFVVLAFRGP